MESEMIIVRAGKMVAAHDQPVVSGGAVLVAGERIREVGTYADLAARFPDAQEIGGEDFLLIPGLVNGHSHGRGLTDFQRGALDNTLETWQLDYRKYVPIDTYDDVALSATRLLKSGVTTTMHNHHHIFRDPSAYQEDFEDALEAYRDVSLRVQFNPGIRNDNPFVYGDNAAFLHSLPHEIRALIDRPPSHGALTGENYVEVVSALHARCDGPMTKIGFGPMGPQWCTRELLREIRWAADELGTPIHIHVLQSVFQKVYALQFLGKSLIAYMRDLGLLGEGVVLGHCVWPTQADIEILARTGTGVTHHPSCNLRVRNGISPVFHLLEAGIVVGLGLDGKSINDDDDMIQEMKVCYLLHRMPSLELDSPHLTARQVFKMATENGAALLGFGQEIARLEPGRRADMVLLDYRAMCAPLPDLHHDPIDVLLYRGLGRHVHTVMVNGRVVVREGRLLTLDEGEIEERLARAAGRSRTEAEKEMVAALNRLRGHLRGYYRGWSSRAGSAPFFRINSMVDGLQ